ncbi:MAG: hypothetical protein UY90_C0038G0006 [Candidatus Peregrinibacteria bacterium GW2011_GWA2_54_9]|nr:MAG: hypothetical protein UY90_C0038G0006 [Candidatus Peregrinibacteria bacterium GW2011_GWA2_54_9]
MPAGLKVSEEQEVQTTGLADAFASWIAVMPQIAYVDEIIRVLKPGGLLMLTESYVAELHDEPRDYWRFSGEALTKLVGGTCDVLVLEPRGGYYSLQAQQKIRYLIDRYDLYNRPFLGKVVNSYALVTGYSAIYRDRRRKRNGKITIGYNLLARKKGVEV